MAAKVFAVGDVLPATSQLQITYILRYGDKSEIKSNNNNLIIVEWDFDSNYYIKILGEDKSHGGDQSVNTYIIDTSNWSLAERTISYSYLYDDEVLWEDLNAPSGYTITFNSNGGTTISDIEEATELPTSLPIPTKSGYTFVAWYYESNFQTRAKAGDTIESNVTLYAKWHNLGSLFTEIANAIREKESSSGTIRDVDFGDRIRGLPSAIELTQAEYDALGTKDANTYYLIVEVE